MVEQQPTCSNLFDLDLMDLKRNVVEPMGRLVISICRTRQSSSDNTDLNIKILQTRSIELLT